MKKKSISLLTVVFAGCLAVCLLAGCGSSEQKSSDEPSQTQAQTEQIKTTVELDTSAVDNEVTYKEELTLDAGTTVLEALKATGLEVTEATGPYGSYVDSIGGLAEKAHGESSGWTFLVNDEMAMETASTLVVEDGDKITWEYVTTFEE